MELREINVEDVFPDEKNPRKDFGDIAALAESCMLNAINPGEPVNPIVVVEDGGVYRIVDGERRYKAMVRNKLGRCHAVVCSDMDEANAMVAMVATDDKRMLSDVERSRGVQQMLLLGVDPERVERAGRMPKGSAAKIRRARSAVDDAGDDMTLDRMLAIAEFADDAEAVVRLSNCREAEWQDVRQAIMAERAKAAKISELEQACREAGIQLEEKPPSLSDGYSYFGYVSLPSEVAAKHAECPDGTRAWICETNYGGPDVRFYEPVSDREEDPEAAARAERAHEIEAMAEHSKERMEGWFAQRANLDEGTPRVRSSLMLGFFSHSNSQYFKEPGDHVFEFAKKHGMDMSGGVRYVAAGAFAAFLYAKNAPKLPGSTAHLALNPTGTLCDHDAGRLAEWIEFADAFVADGYEPDESERELRGIVEGILARTETGTEEEGE